MDWFAYGAAPVEVRASIGATHHRAWLRLSGAGTWLTATVVATFNAVDRVADATGTPLESYKEEATADMRTALGLDAFVHEEK